MRRALTTCLVLAFTVVLSAPAWAQPATGAAAAGMAVSEVPAAWQPALAKAEQAMNGLQSALLARLKEEMASGGARGALQVCHDEAEKIAVRVGVDEGIALGRTSHALRNPSNGAPGWAAPLVRASAGRKASSVAPRVFDLGGKIGVLRPIGFADTCATCHGAPPSIPADVRAALDTLYPLDRATGFTVGDLRGWMWAEVPVSGR